MDVRLLMLKLLNIKEVTEENINIENENFHKFKITFLSENESEKHLGENESNNNSLSMDIV